MTNCTRPAASPNIVKPTPGHHVFVSFIEEFWGGQTTAHVGRVEVSYPNDHYPSEEIRFGTNSKDWCAFREKWDFRYISPRQLSALRNAIKLRHTIKRYPTNP